MHQQAAQATWNPERDLWETDSMDLFSGLSDVFSETLPISGMTRSGRLFLRPQSEPHTGGNEFSSSPGLLRTPCAAEAEGGMLHPNKAEREGQTLRLSSQIVHMVAPDQLKDDLLPTPCASPSGNTPEEHLRKKPGRERVTDLSILVENDLLQSGGKLLPTPLAGDADNGNVNDPESRRSQGRSVGMQNVAPTIVDSFGPYADAIARWERVMGREAPAPTEITDQSRRKCNVHGEERRSREELHRMREAADEETIRERSARGQGSVHESDSLLPGVREHQGRGRKGHASLASEETPKGELPGVRISERPARPSHGQEPGEQRSGEPDDTVRVMPPETPLAGGSSEKAGSEPVGETCICKHRLSAKFVEFLMGQSDGWVTDEELGLSRVQQLRALGNGVVSIQASYAIGWLIERSGNEDLQAMRPRVLAA